VVEYLSGTAHTQTHPNKHTSSSTTAHLTLHSKGHQRLHYTANAINGWNTCTDIRVLSYTYANTWAQIVHSCTVKQDCLLTLV
jgi:hypothetical protein